MINSLKVCVFKLKKAEIRLENNLSVMITKKVSQVRCIFTIKTSGKYGNAPIQYFLIQSNTCNWVRLPGKAEFLFYLTS